MANFFSSEYFAAVFFKAMGGQETDADPNALSGSFAGSSSFSGELTATVTTLADDGSPAQRPARPEEIRKYREQRERAERALREHADRLAGWKGPQEERVAPVTTPLELVELPAPSDPWRLPEPIATSPAKPTWQTRRAPVETVDAAAIEAALAAERAFVALQREAQLQAAIQAAEIEAARRREEEAIIVLLLAA